MNNLNEEYLSQIHSVAEAYTFTGAGDYHRANALAFKMHGLHLDNPSTWAVINLSKVKAKANASPSFTLEDLI